MLTDQQIEAAARKLCEIRGIVPDAQALQMTRSGPSYLKMARDEIRAYLQVQEAVDYAEAIGATVGDKAEPGKCECGHSHAAHLNFAEFSTCRECLCPEYWTHNAEFSAPQSRG